MHTNEVIWHKENGKTKWESSCRWCIMRKVIRKEVDAGGGLDFILDSAFM